MTSNDYVLLQNEINQVSELISRAKEKNLKVVFNPAPITEDIKFYPLDCVDIFILNEIEGESITGESKPETILLTLQSRFPNSTIILTLGEHGVLAYEQGKTISLPAKQIDAVDSTGAGDTFIGYYLAMRTQGMALEKSLRVAVNASALCVGRSGAANSIPRIDEVL